MVRPKCFRKSKHTPAQTTNQQVELNIVHPQPIHSSANRQTSTTESVLSYDTALNNSVILVNEANKTVEFKLPSYDEYIKTKPNAQELVIAETDEQNYHL